MRGQRMSFVNLLTNPSPKRLCEAKGRVNSPSDLEGQWPIFVTHNTRESMCSTATIVSPLSTKGLHLYCFQNLVLNYKMIGQDQVTRPQYDQISFTPNVQAKKINSTFSQDFSCIVDCQHQHNKSSRYEQVGLFLDIHIPNM